MKVSLAPILGGATVWGLEVRLMRPDGPRELLLSAGGTVVPAEEILRRVWDEYADPFTTAVKTTISRLRSKLGDPPVIETVPQAGYRI